MNLKPLGDRVIIKQDDAEQTTASGLYIAQETKEKPSSGVVLAVGEGKVSDAGERLPMPVAVGDRVVYGKFAGQEIENEGEKVVILRADDIIAIQA
ncbi:MAG: co-chaperone GroES [Coriobacteriaceae bacterium]|nr:co-chaperone GroES [Coriobacteriaceae bacterium]MDY3799355.1 co-chaperone GroES [Eggerthellaceae bacterium]MDD6636169.1 co-chaperone GroES [Coriobacteriaceae bacterium]MDD7430283.1 co-chaperone GroES [Coriobacteriaceae bacterium]MDO4498341.1 co-chaperone GroES [Coriobacteriaceae bacterium]